MLTAETLKRFAPNAHPKYVEAFLSDAGQGAMKRAGILDDADELVHFMGQCAAEVDYFRIFRESLNYTTAARLRDTWPKRFGSKSDDELAHLLRNPVELGDAVYGGRMGNTQPGDGFAYRGGGPLQTTGADAVKKFAPKCGYAASPRLLDDPLATLHMACIEWQDAKCGKWARQNDVLAVSKAINTGSATSSVVPVGLKRRYAATERARAIWGDVAPTAAQVDAPPVEIVPKPDATIADLKGSRKLTIIGWIKWKLGIGAGAGTLGLLDQYGPEQLWGFKEYVHNLVILVKGNGTLLLLLGCGVGIVGLVAIQKFMVQDIRNGTYVPSGQAETPPT